VRQATLIVGAALVLLAAVVAAGCGGDGGGGGDRLTKAEFITKADGICKDANSKVPTPPDDLKNVDPTAASTTDEQLDEFGNYVEKVANVFGDEVDELRDLNPPADLENKFDSALETLDEAVKELGEAAEAAKDADRDTLKAKLEESDKHGNEADKLAKEIGLTVCGSS
jgi:hypothetical protein